MTPWFQDALIDAAVWIGLIFVVAYAWAWLDSPSERSRGKYARFVRRPKQRATLVPFPQQDTAEDFCTYGWHQVGVSELFTEDGYRLCRGCSDLRKRTIESFIPKGAA